MNGDWQMRNIYLYLVCFVTLMMIIFGLVAFLNNVTRVILPGYSMSYITLMDMEAEYIYSNRDVPPEEELIRLRDERMENSDSTSQAYLVRNLVSSLAVWLVAVPFYVYHWRKIKVELLESKGGAGHEA